MDTASPQFKRKMETRFGDDWRTIKKNVSRKAEFQTFVASRRLGKNGLRPFGSRGTISSKKSGTGARIRKGPAVIQQPLYGVLQGLRKWFQRERQYGHEVRTTTLRTRLKLDLATEAGRQEVLQQQGSHHFNQAILTACSHRLAKMATPTLARLKGHRNWERKCLFPSVGAVSRKAHKHSHVDPRSHRGETSTG